MNGIAAVLRVLVQAFVVVMLAIGVPILVGYLPAPDRVWPVMQIFASVIWLGVLAGFTFDANISDKNTLAFFFVSSLAIAVMWGSHFYFHGDVAWIVAVKSWSAGLLANVPAAPHVLELPR